jgi:hypothetical protein
MAKRIVVVYIMNPRRNRSAPRTRMICRLAAAALSLALLTASAHGARADVRVTGDLQSLHIEAHNATLAQVMTALGSALHIKINTTVALNQTVNGTYVGSLEQVLSHVLSGYNYVVLRRTMAIEVVGARGDHGVVARQQFMFPNPVVHPPPVRRPTPAMRGPPNPRR